MKTIKKVNDIKNSMAHVTYTDGMSGLIRTDQVPAELRRQHYAEQKAWQQHSTEAS